MFEDYLDDVVVFPHEVTTFKYNGLYVTMNKKGTKTDYRAKFIRWTGDPGIAQMYCSDGMMRNIPSCAITSRDLLPKDETPKEKKILFGEFATS